MKTFVKRAAATAVALSLLAGSATFVGAGAAQASDKCDAYAEAEVGGPDAYKLKPTATGGMWESGAAGAQAGGVIGGAIFNCEGTIGKAIRDGFEKIGDEFEKLGDAISQQNSGDWVYYPGNGAGYNEGSYGSYGGNYGNYGYDNSGSYGSYGGSYYDY